MERNIEREIWFRRACADFAQALTRVPVEWKFKRAFQSGKTEWPLLWVFVLNRSLSKLSENHKIVEIGSTEFKLWQPKESLNHWLNGGGVAVEHLSTAVTLVPLVQCQKYYDFLKAEKNIFQMMCFNPIFIRDLNLPFFGLGPWAIIHGVAKLGNSFITRIWTLMIPFERYLSKLSENKKIVAIRSTKFKLWHS